MRMNSNGSAGVAVLLLLAGVALAAANVAIVASLGPNGAAAIDALRGGAPGPVLDAAAALAAGAPAIVAIPALGPLLLGLVAALIAGRTSASAPTPPPAAVAAPPGRAEEDGALRMLGLLQQEARFIDFIQEDITTYDDAQVGAAVREIHADCRKSLAARIEIARIYGEDEGSPVEVAPGFDPAAVRLTGKVSGEPPFRGTLQHSGWRAVKVALPQSPGGTDAKIIAPAEVEVG